MEVEVFDSKTVIHNYGHGSKGVTLSWGSAHRATEEAAKTGQTRWAVVGCGVIGLSTARLLQRRGFEVTIYAKELPPETTSNSALAVWGPYTDSPPGTVPDARYAHDVRFSYRYFQQMVGDYYGIHWIESYTLSTPEALASLRDAFQDLRPGFEELPWHQHPFPVTSVLRWHSMLIEPPIYLNALLRDFQLAGGRVVIREFSDLSSLLALPEPALMNCTGIGACALVRDESLFPWKGQTTLLLPQGEVDYHLDMPTVAMVPRRDGIVLNCCNWEGVDTFDPDIEAARASVARARAFFSAMR